ncbi:hypothetical protein CAPTEDRAFT_194275 [Capitella teleta]|uniref:Uncharacterized protein n=1 Tax=Capitella teleta TaxID=283909 RepID=R7TJ38_CAPTE|nr:hypothetical protein CAPTEDRAFT_194275 [Capitella teleta]|eukprot:ELT93512.1 hypothetical protein CAPTEDRAFT_194275 [Capitella teleta]
MPIEMWVAIFDCNLVVVEDASHMVMMEKPSEVNELIQNFLLSNMRLVGSAVAHGNRVVTPDNNPEGRCDCNVRDTTKLNLQSNLVNRAPCNLSLDSKSPLALLCNVSVCVAVAMRTEEARFTTSFFVDLGVI